MAFEWNFRELMRPRLADAYARRTYETLPEQPVNPMPTQMDPQGQGWLAAQQARNAQNMQGYVPNEAKQGYGQDYEDRAQSITGEVGQDYYGNAGGDRGVAAAQVTPNQIKDLQSQIEVIEKRLAENKAKLKNWTGNGNQIAAIEARKINAQDPTSVWRWKQGQDQAMTIRKQDLDRIEKEKEKTKEEQKQFIRNKLAATLPTMTIGWGTSPEQIQQYKNTLAGLKTEVLNNKLTDQYNNILELEAQLNGQLPKQKAQMAMNAMANATNLFDVTKEEGGFGKDPKAYHDYLLQQYTAITKEFPEAKYDPEFKNVFDKADKLHKKIVKNPTVRPGGRH